jgi:excisionase family DNA binding protein
MMKTATTTEVSVSTAARILRTSVDTVRRLIDSGDLVASRWTSRGWYRLDYDSVIELMKKNRSRE